MLQKLKIIFVLILFHIPIDAEIKHLHLWFNQGEYLAFKVPLMIFQPDQFAHIAEKFVCIWFKNSIIKDLIGES